MVADGAPEFEEGDADFAPAALRFFAGIWFTITPWRMRDLLNWATANEARVRLGSGLRLAFALFVVALGLTVFRSM